MKASSNRWAFTISLSIASLHAGPLHSKIYSPTIHRGHVYWAFQKLHCLNFARLGRIVLAAGIREIVEVDVLPVAVDPGRDDAEAIEAGAGVPVLAGQFDPDRFPVERYGDLAVARGSGNVLERPIARLAVGIQVRRPMLVRRVAAGVAGPVARREKGNTLADWRTSGFSLILQRLGSG